MFVEAAKTDEIAPGGMKEYEVKGKEIVLCNYDGKIFCAYFGMHGVFNFGPDIGKTDTVEQAEFRAMDRRKAWRIITYSAIIGAVAAIISYYLPL